MSNDINFHITRKISNYTCAIFVVSTVIGHTHLGWDSVTFRPCRVRIRNEAQTVSITLLSARLAAFGIQSENIYRISLFPSNAHHVYRDNVRI